MFRIIKYIHYFLLNTNDIHKIVIQPNKYCIHIVNKTINGFSWGVNGFGSGYISSHTYEINVCETENSTDYKIVSDWIDKNT